MNNFVVNKKIIKKKKKQIEETLEVVSSLVLLEFLKSKKIKIFE